MLQSQKLIEPIGKPDRLISKTGRSLEEPNRRGKIYRYVPWPAGLAAAIFTLLQRSNQQWPTNLCALHKILLTLDVNSREIAPGWCGGNGKDPVSVKNIVPSHLPSFLLPCPQCGNRMVVRAVTPVPLADSAKTSSLDDITYGCVQCSTTMTRTVRS
jgi:hypothetical protein